MRQNSVVKQLQIVPEERSKILMEVGVDGGVEEPTALLVSFEDLRRAKSGIEDAEQGRTFSNSDYLSSFCFV
jgi:hypothetical protein